MRILLDECVPRSLKDFLTKHGQEVLTVQERGWSGKRNGELLSLAEDSFDVLVTLDTNIQSQQNLFGRKIAVVVLSARSNRLEVLRPLFGSCLKALMQATPGNVVQVREEK